MRIGFDIDNVICNTTECVVNYINERLPEVNLKMEDLHFYWVEKNIPKEYQWIGEVAFSDSKMWKNVKLIEGAAEVIEKLYKEGHSIYFVTATTAENFRKKLSFLQRSFPFLSEHYIKRHSISIKEKQLLDLDVLVDDYQENLMGKRTYTSLCYDYPWNRGVKDNGDTFRRVYNWSQIYDVIQEIGQYCIRQEW